MIFCTILYDFILICILSQEFDITALFSCIMYCSWLLEVVARIAIELKVVKVFECILSGNRWSNACISIKEYSYLVSTLLVDHNHRILDIYKILYIIIYL